MRFVLLIFAAFLMAGCRHAEPVSEFDTDRQHRVDLLDPREHHTSRDGVLRVMGPADAVSMDEQAWAYHWRTYSTMGPLLSTNWPLPRRDYGNTGEMKFHLLLLEFDAGGLLIRKHVWSAIESSAGLPATRDVLEQWHTPPTSSPATSPVLPSRNP
ncbi:MAG: hypothetical protein NTU53_16360 [Planctomycetota bacterium]|nr:hypothetical protein [Planctomycetota bacterium]